MTADELIRMAYAQLLGLQANVPKNSASREFINFLHQIIDDLESFGTDLSKFRIPDSAITQSGSGKSMWCDPSYFSAKVDGLLNLFQVSEDKKQIGFLPSK